MKLQNPPNCCPN